MSVSIIDLYNAESVAPEAIQKWRGINCRREKFLMCPSTLQWCPFGAYAQSHETSLLRCVC